MKFLNQNLPVSSKGWLSFACLACVGSSLVIQAHAAKNVLFIMADDMNDWIEPFAGHPDAQTPNMKRFAAKSVVFRNTYVPSPVCSPSRTAMLSGMRPTTSKSWGNADYFRESPNPAVKNVVTLPQYLRGKGYYTANTGKIFHEHTPEGDTLSWDYFKGLKGTKVPAGSPLEDHGLVIANDGGDLWNSLRWGYSLDASFEATADFTAANDIAKQLRAKGNKPFFMGYGSARPHLPWFVPKLFFDKYDKSKLHKPEVLENDLADSKYAVSNGVQAEMVRTNNVINGTHGYLASISFADSCIGILLDSLEKHSFKDSTIVLVMGDHGWHLGEKNHWTKATLWEEATKTPLMIYVPFLKGRGHTNHIVSLQDLYPTILDLLGLPKPAHVEGRSLRPILENPQTKDWIGWSLTSYHTGAGHALRTNQWYLIRMERAGKVGYDLYDMYKDPLQHINLADLPEHQNLIAKLSADMDLIIAGQPPVSVGLYGDYVTKLNVTDKRLNHTILGSSIYDLKVFTAKGNLVQSFKGKGVSILEMLQNPMTLGLPAGSLLYKVYDANQKNIDQGKISRMASFSGY
jgi:arylsulfatase A-like enzyme